MTVSMEHLAFTPRSGRQLELPRDGLLRLRASGHGLRLGVEHGTLLVTREGDAEDHVLEAGTRLVVTGPGLVVAWALVPTTLSVSRPADPAALEPAACAA